MISLFVLDDSLTSSRFTTRTEQLTKCCEPLHKMRVRLEVCKIDLPPPPLKLLYITDRSKAISSFKYGCVLGNSCSLGLRYVL